MRVGLIADTHGIYDKLSLKLKDLDLDLILHAGDYAKDAEEISLISGVKTVAVRETMTHLTLIIMTRK